MEGQNWMKVIKLTQTDRQTQNRQKDKWTYTFSES
jgi:hypothetical protein